MEKEYEKIKMSWKHFLDSEPYSELIFCYKDCFYLIEHRYYCGKEVKPYWVIEKAGLKIPSGFGDDNIPIIAKTFEKIPSLNYHNNEKWNDMLSAYYELLSIPCFDGKSFKEIIEDIYFYD